MSDYPLNWPDGIPVRVRSCLSSSEYFAILGLVGVDAASGILSCDADRPCSIPLFEMSLQGMTYSVLTDGDYIWSWYEERRCPTYVALLCQAHRPINIDRAEPCSHGTEPARRPACTPRQQQVTSYGWKYGKDILLCVMESADAG